jgi:hypothetical protein
MRRGRPEPHFERLIAIRTLVLTLRVPVALEGTNGLASNITIEVRGKT